MKKVLTVLFTIFTFCSIAYATKPGARVERLDAKDLTVDIYLVSISVNNSEINAAEFVWIPKDVIGDCLGKNSEDCARYVHDHYVYQINSQGRSGFNPKWFKKQKYPTQVLSEYVYDLTILNQLAKMSFIQELLKRDKAEVHFVISEDKKIKAQVHWELWPDFGENFKINRLLL